MVEDRDVTAREGSELFGIPIDTIRQWQSRRKLTPSGMLTGRGPTGRNALFRLSELAALVAAQHARHTKHAQQDPARRQRVS